MQETEEFLKGLTRGISNTIRLAYERGVKDGEEHREAKAIKNIVIDNTNFDLGEMWLYFMFCNECSILKVESEGD